MGKRSSIAMAGMTLLALFIVWLESGRQPAAGATSEPAALFRVIFGAHRLEAGGSEASVSSEAGGLTVQGWMGATVERAGEGSWRVKMQVPSEPPPSAAMGGLRAGGGRGPTLPVPGFLISLEPAAAGPVTIRTGRGDIVFRPPEIPPGAPRRYLDGFVQIERVPAAQLLAASDADEDYPALAAAPDGTVWAAWVSFAGNGERLLLARVDGGARAELVQANEGLTEVFHPQVTVDGAGRVWIVWSELRGENWDLYARAWTGRNWTQIQRLTEAPGSDIYAALIADRSGTLWLAWQGDRQGNTDIFLKSCRDGTWSETIPVGSHPAGDWEPALAADSRGQVYVAWDSYRTGAYDIYLARYDGGRVSQPERLTGGDRLHIRASLAVDARDRLWIAWEEGDEQWGQDRVQTLGGLHRERRVVVASWNNGRLHAPAQTLAEAQTSWTGAMTEKPRLQCDGSGALWAFYRINYMQRIWQAAAARYGGSRWSDPLVLDRSFGRQSAPLSAAPGKDGAVWVAYAGDNRSEQDFFEATHNNVCLARIPPSPAGSAEPALGARVPVAAAATRSYMRTWPQHQVRAGGRTYRLVWGELHRHTDINHHGRPDGSLEDAYRYARDVASLDFFATTDHIEPAPGSSGTNPMTWWRSQKFADLHRAAGVFEPLYAYESSKSGPQGHRNVVFPRRGGRLFGGLRGPTVNDPRPLWQALREAAAPAIAIPHQLTDSQVDWSIHDPDFTPVLELYQSRRQNYEYDGAPQPPGVEQVWGKKAGSWAWDALARGRKIGFIASSDHMSTHMAYAAAYVDELSREGVFRALLARRTYAASDNIVLDFRLVDGSREYLMGEEARIQGAPDFDIQVKGTGPIAVVEVIRDAKVIFSKEPAAREAELRFIDNQPPSGEAYYYVRVRQQDGHLAWSSPIWVRR